MSLLADETVSSFETENMQSDSESQRDTERQRRSRRGEITRIKVRVCVCVGCISLLWMPTCESNIRVLHLIAGADGSINRTSVCVTTVYPSQACVRVCRCRGVCVCGVGAKDKTLKCAFHSSSLHLSSLLHLFLPFQL